ncbi:TIGR03067 domain-containing protein [Singulisphaera sp. GP187]|uniref:TIGR03067 domain-containing protein n=1 Tax=Singulisphaera sp. GP187 TaxID=1882752 RepID=UPI0009410B50|nr:TIGR03067 domain-containing protein [Singulisphaera sp. GP187]
MLLISVVLQLGADAPKPNRVETELARFQGTWQQLSGVVNGVALPSEVVQETHVRFRGNQKSVRAGVSSPFAGLTVVLNPGESPKQIDVKADEDGAAKGSVSRGIYQFDEDTLTICNGAIDDKRPTEFTSKPGSGRNLQVFRRLHFGDGPEPGKGTPLEVPGVVSIAAPGEEFVWTSVRSGVTDGVETRTYACSKEGSTAAIVLTMVRHSADTEAAKVATLKGHFNGLLLSLRKFGFTEIRGPQPSLEPPIPARTLYSASMTGPDGQTTYLGAATVFGKCTYSLQVFAPTEKEAKRLVQVVETLKENR